MADNGQSPEASPALNRWADFLQGKRRTGVRLERPSRFLVPNIVQAEDDGEQS